MTTVETVAVGNELLLEDSSMKAMVLREARPIEEHPLEAVEMPAPTPGPDEIRIRVRACGVCHTDLHTVEGELALPKLPVIPGHQIVGVVDQLGADVTRFRLGDRVGVAWLYSSCGQCDFCRRGLARLTRLTRLTLGRTCATRLASPGSTLTRATPSTPPSPPPSLTPSPPDSPTCRRPPCCVPASSATGPCG